MLFYPALLSPQFYLLSTFLFRSAGEDGFISNKVTNYLAEYCKVFQNYFPKIISRANPIVIAVPSFFFPARESCSFY